MCFNVVLELSMILDHEEFDAIYSQCFCADPYSRGDDDEFVDCSLEDKGMIIRYRDSQFKKKIRLIVHLPALPTSSPPSSEKLVHKLDKLISKYFDGEYHLQDFTVSGMTISTELDVGNAKCLREYLHVLKRIGRVKGFSPVDYERLEEIGSFCLAGNSNATDFLAYDLAQAIAMGLSQEEVSKSQREAVLQGAEGLLRIEVHLKKQKAIQRYTHAYSTANQIMELSENRQAIFMDTFVRVVPYGDFRKKKDATEILRREVKDETLRRRMLRLLTLIPEKKSLYLSQRAMAYRHPQDLLMEFAKINLSPISIGKRQDVKYLKNLYDYI